MADDDDDPQLRSMRAAWRSLPEEDPPERGLAELMAAARQHAEAMAEARAPWWKRALAILRRPAVLALASVLVLLGGVFAVTATHKGVSPEPAGVEQSAAPVASPPEPAKPEAAAAPSTGGLAAPASPPPPPPAASIATPKIAPAHHSATRALAAPKPTPAPAQQLAQPPAAAADDEPDAPAPATRAPVSKSASSDAASSPRRQLNAQMLTQCRTAAARGDCETAKKIAQRIQADDAAYYAQSVATDAAIAKCLSE
jgi:hypothetical protein